MHRMLWMLSGFFVCTLTMAAQTATPAKPASPIVDSETFLKMHLPPGKPAKPLSPEIDKLISQMTLKEKVGQMTQLEIGMISDGIDQAIKINPAKLRKAIVEYGVGSILNVKDEALPVARWHEIIREIQAAAAESRLKIPVLYGIDSIHGANYVQGSTMFPQPLAMASTWNPELMLKASQITAAQTRAAGIPWNFSPVLDVGRQPAWPRMWETFGEDPYLASVMGVASVRGYEGTDISSPQQVASTLKHYVGYSFPLSGHDRTPALIPDSTLREFFLPSFAAAVKAGAHSVMVNSGDVNGIPGHTNKYLLTDVLRGELGFQGMVVSDWEDIKKLATVHRTAANEKEATRQAVLAGIDMSMVPSDYSFADLLVALVEEGKVPMSRIDEAVRRVLALKWELGLFQDPLRGISAKPIDSAEADRVALEAARESITLLKNANNTLPLAKTARILVTGPTADSLIPLNNGWTYHWQGNRPGLYPQNYPTILGAIKAMAPQSSVTHVPGAAIDKEVDIAAAVAAARNSDVVIASLGEWSYTETPGNINDLTLPEAQLRLVEQLATAGKPIVLVLAQGRPRIINSIVGLADAIVLAPNPGNQGGRAVVDILFGEVNPSGRLPFTYPPAPNALLTYDHKAYQGGTKSFDLAPFRPQFAFGSGLSYTTFAYSDLKVSPPRSTGEREVSVRVANTGQRAGKEVVQLYVGARHASVAPAGKKLKRFAKVDLPAGEAKVVTFTLRPDDFAVFNAQGKPVIEGGEFDVMVGGLQQTVQVSPGAVARRRR
jgi:beta-glucosidase